VALVMYAATFLLGGFTPFLPFVSVFYNLTVLAMPFFVLDLVRRPESAPARFLSHKVWSWFGKRSYGIYIWHLIIYFPIQAFFNDVFVGRTKLATLAAFPFAVAATIGVSVLSWNFIETPALRIKARYARPD
jgi:peptidoglycan/LPS O-acetylase OafA/YrhL